MKITNTFSEIKFHSLAFQAMKMFSHFNGRRGLEIKTTFSHLSRIYRGTKSQVRRVEILDIDFHVHSYSLMGRQQANHPPFFDDK